MINPKVVDISHYTNVTSLSAAYAAGVRGLIHKATQGTEYIDPLYLRRKEPTVAAGFFPGAYHFADNSDPKAQVDHFFETVQPDPDTFMALDYEPNGAKTMSLENARIFLDYAAQKLGRKLVLYSGNLIKEQLKEPDEFFNAHPLWLAHYSAHPVLPIGWSKYFLWQFTGDGVGPQPHAIPGLGTGLDINSYEGSDDQLFKDWTA